MISIHALHEESDIVGIVAVVLLKISIHALHEESDLSVASAVTQHLISIHALHEESDDRRDGRRNEDRDFNPRSP